MTVESHIETFLKELPKCEHHVHLEGTLSPSLLFTLIEKHGVELPEDFPKTPVELEQRYNRFADLDDFLHFYYIGMNVLKDESDFYELAYQYLEKAASQGVKHLEMFFDPQGHVPRGVSFETFLSGFTKACERAENEFGLTTKLIMCLLRHMPVQDCHETLKMSEIHFENGLIHGLGLDSLEKPFPPELFVECYETVKLKFPHVGLTAHAGEEGGPDFVSNSLDLLKVTRIDHGVNSAKDAALMKRLAAQKTLLSVCPMSNVKLQVVEHVGQLPLRQFLEAGVPFSINSDDPAYFNAYILENYLEVHRHFGFLMEEWCIIANHGIEGSWIEDLRKEELKNEVQRVYNKYISIV